MHRAPNTVPSRFRPEAAGTSAEGPWARAAAWARDNMGLEFKQLRAGGVIESAIKSAINSAIRRGELERIDATRIRRRT